MASEWPIVKLKEVLTADGYIRGPFGSALRRSELKDEGVPVYEQQHAISDTREFRYFVDKERYERLHRFSVRENDLIISCSGTLGHVSMIRSYDPEGIISQALLLLRPNKSVIDPRYLYYFMSSQRGRASLIGVSSGSVQVNIARREIIEAIDLPLPPLHVQRAIAHILGTLDDKIELNSKMNQTLEGIARAIFKSWFVDLDPVRAKAAVRRKHPEWSNERVSREACPNLKPEIAELFPDSFVDSELGKIPTNWGVFELEAISHILNGFAFKSKDYCGPEGIRVLRTRNFAESGYALKRADDVFLPRSFLKSHKNYICEPFDFHLVMVGASVGKTALLLPDVLPALRNQNMWCFRPKKTLLSKFFLNYAVRRKVESVMSWADGSARSFFRKSDFGKHRIVVPPESLLRHFEEKVRELFDLIASKTFENELLNSIRDTLLPKLISAELRIPDVEKVLERAL